MGFALNRVSCGQYYCGEYADAVYQNARCMELMDNENIYATLYNAGIFLRNLGKCTAALDQLEKVTQRLPGLELGSKQRRRGK